MNCMKIHKKLYKQASTNTELFVYFIAISYFSRSLKSSAVDAGLANACSALYGVYPVRIKYCNRMLLKLVLTILSVKTSYIFTLEIGRYFILVHSFN